MYNTKNTLISASVGMLIGMLPGVLFGIYINQLDWWLIVIPTIIIYMVIRDKYLNKSKNDTEK